jgi:hypothetical protein
MAAKDLITSARAAQEVSGYSSGSDPTGLLAVLITACSDAIEKYCKRRFLTHFYDELYNGSGDKRLLLRQYPIQSLQSVRYMPVFVCRVQNTNTALNQQARAAVTATGLQLTRVASGVLYTETLLTWTAYPTLSGLMNAVTALGNGWQGEVVSSATSQFAGDYGNWPSSDLYVPNSYGDPLEGSGVQTSQGNLNARGVFAALLMHTYELQGYQWDARGWLLRAIPYTDPELLHPEDLIWPVGINNFRIQYTAGYSTVPEAVQDACAMLVAYRWFEASRDPSLVTNTSQGEGWRDDWPTLAAGGAFPPKVRALLAPYVRRSIATDQG